MFISNAGHLYNNFLFFNYLRTSPILMHIDRFFNFFWFFKFYPMKFCYLHILWWFHIVDWVRICWRSLWVVNPACALLCLCRIFWCYKFNKEYSINKKGTTFLWNVVTAKVTRLFRVTCNTTLGCKFNNMIQSFIMIHVQRWKYLAWNVKFPFWIF